MGVGSGEWGLSGDVLGADEMREYRRLQRRTRSVRECKESKVGSLSRAMNELCVE